MQRNAMPVWRGEGDFLDLLKADRDVAKICRRRSSRCCSTSAIILSTWTRFSRGCSGHRHWRRDRRSRAAVALLTAAARSNRRRAGARRPSHSTGVDSFFNLTPERFRSLLPCFSLRFPGCGKNGPPATLKIGLIFARSNVCAAMPTGGRGRQGI